MPAPCEVDFVLVRPSRAANVAAACRALKNMGFARLRLVAPPAELARPEARALAYDAWDVLDGARRHDTLAEALAEARFVVATSSRPGPAPLWARELPALAAARAGGRLAVVFGPEASGLSGAELNLAHATLTIPSDPAQPSLNLAQAVLLVAYDLRLGGLGPASEAPDGGSGASGGGGAEGAGARASVGEMEGALRALRESLLAIGYLNPANPEAVLRELRGLLARAGPTQREVTLLRGLARQAAWAGEEIERLRDRLAGAAGAGGVESPAGEAKTPSRARHTS
ncbi:MAG: RNA methyltransferase [Vicinamibacteria bacterium]